MSNDNVIIDNVFTCPGAIGDGGSNNFKPMNSTDPHTPAIAAQRTDYLETVMRAYMKGGRKSKAMIAMLEGMGDSDIVELAAHYARQRARTVVYVPLPSPSESK